MDRRRKLALTSFLHYLPLIFHTSPSPSPSLCRYGSWSRGPLTVPLKEESFEPTLFSLRYIFALVGMKGSPNLYEYESRNSVKIDEWWWTMRGAAVPYDVCLTTRWVTKKKKKLEAFNFMFPRKSNSVIESIASKHRCFSNRRHSFDHRICAKSFSPFFSFPFHFISLFTPTVCIYIYTRNTPITPSFHQPRLERAR